MELVLAPGCGLWDWGKGPGGGLGSGPGIAFTISKDTDQVCPRSFVVSPRAWRNIHSLTHSFVDSLIH